MWSTSDPKRYIGQFGVQLCWTTSSTLNTILRKHSFHNSFKPGVVHLLEEQLKLTVYIDVTFFRWSFCHSTRITFTKKYKSTKSISAYKSVIYLKKFLGNLDKWLSITAVRNVNCDSTARDDWISKIIKNGGY